MPPGQEGRQYRWTATLAAPEVPAPSSSDTECSRAEEHFWETFQFFSDCCGKYDPERTDWLPSTAFPHWLPLSSLTEVGHLLYQTYFGPVSYTHLTLPTSDLV